MGKVAGRFARVEPRRPARAFALGLLADLPRKNCWTIAEHAGNAGPAGMQHLLLGRARGDAGRGRDDIRDFVVEHLGAEDAVLVVDGTGGPKKGTASAGAQRRYTGTAGRVENSRLAVHLVYASAAGHAAIDCRLYIRRWRARSSIGAGRAGRRSRHPGGRYGPGSSVVAGRNGWSDGPGLCRRPACPAGGG